MIIKKDQAIQREVSPGVFQTHYIDKHSESGGISMGLITLKPGTSIALHTHKVEDAMIILKGKGMCHLGNEKKEVKKGMAVLVPAGVPHGFENNSDEPIVIVYCWPSVNVERVVLEG